MKLEDLLKFDYIVIQCHNNPDADAIASGYGILTYLKNHGKRARLVYGGDRPIRKSNLVLMVHMLDIPIEHIQELGEEPDLLLTVDCQYGEANVQRFVGERRNIAVIDHHIVDKKTALPKLHRVRDNYGSCSTVVWEMLWEADFLTERDEKLSTALYYGLYMDTGKLQELRHPKDKDLRDQMEFRCNKSILFQFQNSNLSLEEIKITGKALVSYDYHEGDRFAIVEASRCDPNILGVISDMLIEVDAIDVCIAYCTMDDGVKLSVRSCVRETRADELAAYVAENIGSGGGHPRKAGGFLNESRVYAVCEKLYDTGEPDGINGSVHKLLSDRTEKYFREQMLVYAGSDQAPDLSGEPVFEKKRLPMGYVKASDIYPVGTKVNVRMLEGDLLFTVQEDTYFMIGIESEVYKNDEAYFLEHNDPVDDPYVFHGEYAPTVHKAICTVSPELMTEIPKSLKDYAKTCVPKEGSRVHAQKLTCRTKVFVPWSDSYLLGQPGDWLVARQENLKDVYIVKRDIFAKSYERQL